MAGKSDNVLRANHVVVTNAKVRPGESRSEWRIEGIRGLVLRCSESGSAVWWYVYQSGKATRRIKIGDRDSTPLADAKSKALGYAKHVNEGRDPSREKAIQREADDRAVTFADLYRMRLEKGADLKPRTKEFYGTCIEGAPKGHKTVLQLIGSEPIEKLTRQQIVAVINKVEQRGSLTSHDQAKQAMSAILGWAVKHGMLTFNPAIGIARRAKAVPRETKASPEDLSKLWHACSGTDAKLTAEMAIIIKLAMLTGQRRNEIAGARLSELDLDGPSATWTMPGNVVIRGRVARVVHGRTKNGKEHMVPLSTQAAQLWREALALRLQHVGGIGTEEDAEWKACVFPSYKEGTRRMPHIHGESVTRAVARTTAALGIKDVTTHDLRRTFATWAGDNGVTPDIVSRILNHTPTDVTRRHYMQSKLDVPARNALQAWADYVEALAVGGS
ncbi:MAG: site-specific integrase [Hyphomicrobiaceae bacterium]